MSRDNKQKYSADLHIAEIYDQVETQTEDIELICRLIGPRHNLAIFEPFCGTGRVAIPLARRGHHLVVLDESEEMLGRFQKKLEQEPQVVQDRIRIITSPVFATDWPVQQDVVLLGGNCFYEVSSSDEQRALIHRAASALRRGGHVYIDNDDHQSVELSPQWRKPSVNRDRGFPSGKCKDGTHLEGSTETAWFDIHGRFVHYVRHLKITHVDGEVTHHEWRETCRPVIMEEILTWAEQACLIIENTFGDRKGSPYGPKSSRAIVWAQRE